MEKAEKKLELILKYFVDLTPKQIHLFEQLETLYTEWNGKINVISRKDMEGLYEKHVLHSLAIAAFFKFYDRSEVIDIGTGGGFPGIPLAIFFPHVNFHLIDSIGKKIKVVEAIAAALQLKNVSTSQTRVEDIKNRTFDIAVSRAVAPLKELWQWSKPLLRKQKEVYEDGFSHPNGLVCMKGGELSAEIADSGCRPEIVELSQIFKEEFFQKKYILYVSR